jgi:hypothetical protein
MLAIAHGADPTLGPVSLQRGIDGSEPLRPEPITSLAGAGEIRPATRTFVLATGTLACPDCDAPVAPAGPLTPADPLACPYCAHTAKVRDFLSLTAPTRPARVDVRVSVPAAALAPRRTRS